MGAQAMLIALDPNSFIEPRQWNDNSESKYDGTGSSITIPTLLIDEKDAEELLELVRGQSNFDAQVILKADIDIADKGKRTVNYSLSYGSVLDLEPSLVLELYEY